MKSKKEITEYLDKFAMASNTEGIVEKLENLKNKIIEINNNGGCIYIFGNGGSISISDHFAIDMTKNAGVKTMSLSNSATITCLSNDYGYEEWMLKSAQYYITNKDLVIFISSSGESNNIIKTARFCKESGIFTVTFSGFNNDNSLKKIGDTNFWVNSKGYNIVENIHQIWLLCIVDMIIGKSEYPAS